MVIEKVTGNIINSFKAIQNGICQRCGSKALGYDYAGIIYCQTCYEFGEVTSETNLIRKERSIVFNRYKFELNFSLTYEQKYGSDFLFDCYKNRKNGYLQAVCGAGKTEITLQVVLEALNQLLKICFVTPRVEVLKEIVKRFKKHFPKTVVKLLYADNKDFEHADLLFSTPQQLINFYKEFDLIILDEVDAFPYANNPKLERLVNKSLSDKGIILYMSATINKDFLNRIKYNHLSYFSIASRYHQLDLPLPTLKRVNHYQDLIKKLLNIIRKKISNKRSQIIFVPTINYGEKLNLILIENNIPNEFISSKTAYKQQIIKEFRRKDFYILIATTVLERGVTFKDIDCIICNADNHVFTKESLIQISGRVGRIENYQSGEILFLFESNTKAIKNCIKEIKKMNVLNHNEM